MDIDVLRTQHVEISTITRELTHAITHAVQPTGIGHLRWRLARLLLAHLALEDRIVYPALQRLDDPARREEAARMQQEMGDLAGRFATYTSAWSDDRIAREWPLFCNETRLILNALNTRIALEERFYQPLSVDSDVSTESLRPSLSGE